MMEDRTGMVINPEGPRYFADNKPNLIEPKKFDIPTIEREKRIFKIDYDEEKIPNWYFASKWKRFFYDLYRKIIPHKPYEPYLHMNTVIEKKKVAKHLYERRRNKN